MVIVCIKEIEIPYKKMKPAWADLSAGRFFGDVAGVGYYKKGKKEGKWETFFDNKKVESRRFYKNDKKVGTWEGFFYNRNPAWIEYYQNDSAVGLWQKWYSNGVLEEENSCHLAEAEGFKKHYYADGKPQWKWNCRFGIKEGEATQYYPSGLLQLKYRYRNGQLNGPLNIYRANGRLWKREYWKQDVRDSIWAWYDTSEVLIRESRFHNGTGTAFGFCPSGDARLTCAESTFVKKSSLMASFIIIKKRVICALKN